MKFTPGFVLTQDGFTTCVETDAGAHCFRIDKAVGAELCLRANAAPELYEALAEAVRIERARLVLADGVDENLQQFTEAQKADAKLFLLKRRVNWIHDAVAALCQIDAVEGAKS